MKNIKGFTLVELLVVISIIAILLAVLTRQYGLNYKYYEGTWSSLPNFNSLTPIKQGKANNFGFVFDGYVDVPSNGNYTFYISSDDGSKLTVYGNYTTLIVDNDGLHSNREASGSLYLLKGKHLVNVKYFQRDGGYNLILSYSGPGITKKEIPVNKLFRCSQDLPGDFTGDCSVDIFDLKQVAESWLDEYDFEQFDILAHDWMK
jgi:prepilin-type N-terminal cleavage/methylation domain-containing protein